jgi:hypothetical protein
MQNSETEGNGYTDRQARYRIRRRFAIQVLRQFYRNSIITTSLVLPGCLSIGSFVPKKDEVTREWRKLHNEEHNDLYSSPNIVRVIKLRTMRWAGHVARMGLEEKRIQGFGGET